MNNALPTSFVLSGCITPATMTPWQPAPRPATSSPTVALATPVDPRPRKRGAAVTHG